MRKARFAALCIAECGEGMHLVLAAWRNEVEDESESELKPSDKGKTSNSTVKISG